jgi:hypothetical protein
LSMSSRPILEPPASSDPRANPRNDPLNRTSPCRSADLPYEESYRNGLLGDEDRGTRPSRCHVPRRLARTDVSAGRSRAPGRAPLLRR